MNRRMFFAGSGLALISACQTKPQQTDGGGLPSTSTAESLRAETFPKGSIVFPPEQAGSRFVGQLVLLPHPTDPDLRIVGRNFRFRQSAGQEWQANEGDVTDGASIPRVFMPLIGFPYERTALRAAVLHDRYCKENRGQRVRTWRDTHRMFYDALTAAKADRLRSKMMYFAVHSFGPRWTDLDPGQPCTGVFGEAGAICIQVVQAGIVNGYREANYEAPEFDDEFEQFRSLLSKRPDISADAIADYSDSRKPNDPFLARGGLATR